MTSPFSPAGWRRRLRRRSQRAGPRLYQSEADRQIYDETEHPRAGLGLDDGLMPRRATVERCEMGRWLTWRCASGHLTTAWIGCGRLECERCRESSGRQRAKRTWEATSSLGLAWSWWVLTVPLDVRAAVGELGPAGFRRLAAETVGRWYAVQGIAGTGQVVFVHPVGSACLCRKCGKTTTPPHGGSDDVATCCGSPMEEVDGEEWHPHAEVGTPLVAVRDLDGVDGGRILRPYISDVARDLLHWMWAGALGNLVGRPVDVVVCHYSYRTGARKVRHRIRYASRAFPGWARWVTGKGGMKYGALSNRLAQRFRDVVKDSLDLETEPAAPFVCAHRTRDDPTPCGRDVEPRPLVGDPCHWSSGPPVHSHPSH